MLKIYNTQTRQKEDFHPIEPGKVRMYVCGPTVYDFVHVGNFRGPIFYNLVRNWLEAKGSEVNYVLNYTDIDDKIINRAKEENSTPQEISEKYIIEYQKDYQALGLRPHTSNPRVSEHLDDIIKMVTGLLEKGKAYEIEGDVYFHVPAFGEYGKLSNRNIDELQSGHRIEVDSRKKHEADFALWKATKPGEPSWDSPWGKGRPGWAIECSAMSMALLGETIDIHGGGLDLVFPHHENEIAQSEGCSGHPFVKYWMHNNMLQFGEQKMSKSLGNIRTARSFLSEYPAEVFKYLMLSANYRSLLDFSDEQVHRAISNLARFYSAFALAEKLVSSDLPLVPLPDSFQKLLDKAASGLEEALDDDFNTPEAFARFFEVIRQFNQFCRKPGPAKPEMKAVAEVTLAWFKKQGELFALFGEPPSEFLKGLDDLLLREKSLERADIEKLVQERTEARAEKNFSKSDELRDQLAALGIELRDSVSGTEWEVAKSQ